MKVKKKMEDYKKIIFEISKKGLKMIIDYESEKKFI